MNPSEQSPPEEKKIKELVRLLDRHWEALRRGEHIELEAMVALHPDGAGGIADFQMLDALNDAVRAINEDSQSAPRSEDTAPTDNTDPRLASTETFHPAVPGSPYGAVVGDRIGKYEIREILRPGGQAATFKAWDPDTERTVVVKVYHSCTARPEAVIEEAQKLTKVRSPYVVQCYHVERLDGLCCLVLEYIAGQNLTELYKAAPLSVSQSLSLIAQVAEGLAAVHARGLLHRDIKPGNIVVGHDAVPKLLDFGLAKSFGDPALRDVSGTFCYMAPEQARGDMDRIDQRTDIFGLGATLYFLLTGHAPYEGSPEDVRRAAREGDVVPPRQRNPKIPADVNRLCMRCLAKSPENRLGSALELAKVIRRRGLHRLGVFAGAAALLLVPAAILGSRFLSQPRPTTTGTDEAPLKTEQREFEGWIDLRVWKAEHGKPAGRGRRLHDPDVLPLTPGDWVQVEIELTTGPAFMYVVNLEAAGTVAPLYPWNGYDWQRRGPEEPRQRLLLPDDLRGAIPLAGGNSGIEGLLLMVRPTPLPRSADRELPTLLAGWPKQSTLIHSEERAWLENGAFADKPGRARLLLERPENVDDPVLQVRHAMTGALSKWFPYTAAVLYAFRGK